MKKTKKVEVRETVEHEAWACDGCGTDITLRPGEHARKREGLRVIVYYGPDVAHTPRIDLVDADFDFCEACVTKAIEPSMLGCPTYKEETARYLERVAALLRKTDKGG